MNNKVDAKQVGNTIAQLRKKNNLTQSALAEKMFVSDKAISRWETGEGLPEITNLMELARIFNVSLESLLKGEFTEEISNENNAIAEEKNLQENKENKITEIKEQQTEDKEKETVKKQQPKTEDKFLTKNIISVVLGGLSIVINFFFPIFIGLVLGIIGLVLAKNPQKTTLQTVAKITNIAGIIVSILIMVIVLVLVIIFGSQFLSIFNIFQSRYHSGF